MTGLQRHVPELALAWAAETPEERWRQIDGTLCFADISGFTALAERLAERGRMGGEELVETLGRVFAEMLDIAHQRGGSLLKFGGDALLLFFQSNEQRTDHAVQAASAAVEMRQALRKAADIPTSVGPLKLTMSVGLHSGAVDFFLVGGSHRELILLGPAANKVVEIENTANAREIVVSTETAALLPGNATRPRADGELILRWRKAPIAPRAHTRSTTPDPAFAQTLFPDHLGMHLASGPPDPEHRIACIAFIRFSGADVILANDGPEVLADALQTTVGEIQAVLVDEGVTLLAIDLDRDGGKFFLAAGVPHAHEDDEGVMLRAMRRIVDANLPLPLQVGVNRGHVFAAEVGTKRRAAYSAMGDTTNTAARIAAQTPIGAIFAPPGVLDQCLTRFEVTPAKSLLMKGKKEAQVVFSVGEPLGLREREGLDVTELIGRESELRTLTHAIERVNAGEGQVLSVTGESGLGKTRLLNAIAADLKDMTVLSFRAEPYGSRSPYRMLRDPLRTLLNIGQGDPQSMADALRQSIQQLDESLLPWSALIGAVVNVHIEPSENVRSLDPQFLPDRTASALSELLRAVVTGPLAILVDDAHWCDQASVELLKHWETVCGASAWLLLVAGRGGSTGYRPNSGDALTLEPMADIDIRRLVEIATEAAPPKPDVVDSIVTRAAGNPLFASEIVRTVRDLGSAASLPVSLEAAFGAQIDALDRPAQRILRYASVLGRSSAVPVLAELFAHEGHAFDPAILERLTDFIIPEANDRLQFRSGLLRDTTYEGLSFRLRRRLHKAAGEAIEQRADDPMTVAAALALHFSRGEQFERAWTYAREAGNRARDGYANADAALHYQAALEAARRTGTVEVADALTIWSDLGEVHERSGEISKALVAYRAALRLVGQDKLARAKLLYKRAWAKERAGMLSMALRDLTIGARLAQTSVRASTKASAPGAEATLAQLESLRAMVYLGQDRPRIAGQTARRAAQHARSAHEGEALVRALSVLEFAHLELHGPGTGEHLEEALAIANRIDDTGLRAMVTNNLGALYSFACRWNEAVEMMAEGRDLFLKTGNYIESAYAGANIGEILVNQCRFDDAETELTNALRIMRSSDYTEGVATIEVDLSRIALARGEIDHAIALAEKSEAEFVRLGQPHFVLLASLAHAEALVRAGDAATALTVVEAAVKGAGSEAAYMEAKTAQVRARALIASQREVEAMAEIETGLEHALAQNHLHDQALLLSLRAEITSDENQQQADDDLKEARSIFAQLGIIS